MPNMKSIISSHNKHVLSNSTTHNLTPAIAERNQIVHSKENASRQMLSVYQATVTTETTTETYVGLATNFKERYRNH